MLVLLLLLLLLLLLMMMNKQHGMNKQLEAVPAAPNNNGDYNSKCVHYFAI